MPWLPMYLVSQDAPPLLALLNEDPDLAFLVTAGAGRWIAHSRVPDLSLGRTALWNVPSGPLPLLGTTASDADEVVADPWAGWTENRKGADPAVPYFGAGHPGVIWSNLRIQARDVDSTCGLSSFEWIGNRYAGIGSAATTRTERWWKSLRGRVRKITHRVPRARLDSSSPPEIYAFRSAYELMMNGRNADNNP